MFLEWEFSLSDQTLHEGRILISSLHHRFPEAGQEALLITFRVPPRSG
jgi:hypothetical protein